MINVSKMKRILLLGISLLFIFLFLNPGLFRFKASSDNTNLPKNRIIVKFKPYTSSSLKNSLFQSFGIQRKEALRLSQTYVVNIPERRAGEIIGRFLKNPLVEYAEEDYVVKAVEIPNDPLFPDQWGLSKIKSPSSWDISHGLSSINIAIVDTGISASHADLGSKITKAANCTTSSGCILISSAFDDNGHGSHVAGIASSATNNSTGISGTAYDTSLVSVKVLDSNGSGYYSWVANGIVWAADNGAKVINLSLGGTSSSTTLLNAVNYAWNKGVVVVAAAGNSNSSRRFYPAYYSNSIATAATDQNDKKASFSNYGSWVDVAAPGVSILSTYNNGDYAYLSGTSMATPFVSGLAGLVFGANPTWTNSQVRNKIQSTSDAISGTGTYWAYGRINACKALGGCSETTPTPTPTPTISSTPTPTSFSTPTPAPTPSSSPTPTPTPIPTPTSTPTPTPALTPTPTPIPWWCVRWPFLCR